MKKVIILHGSYGHPSENWFPWLKEQIEALGNEAYVPEFPTPEGQNLENWLKVLFDEHGDIIDENTIFVAHSISCSFVLNILEQKDVNIDSAFLIGGFTGKVDNEVFDEVNKTFSQKDFDFETIKSRCGRFVVFHSDDDPFVEYHKGIKLAEDLGVKDSMHLVPNAGHFSERSGYKTFPLLLEAIKKQLDS